MKKSYHRLLENNKKWSQKIRQSDPQFFEDQAQDQSPEYLWIGCSDSRVPANEITGTRPGELFVHRNIANMVVHTDMNLLSVLSYAVEILEVKHVIVCGHYGCGGVAAAMSNKQYGLIDNWLRHIKDVYRLYAPELEAIADVNARENRLVELNVIEQVLDLSKTSIVQNAWENNKKLHLHGWVYDLNDGIIKDLKISLSSSKDLHEVYKFE